MKTNHLIGLLNHTRGFNTIIDIKQIDISKSIDIIFKLFQFVYYLAISIIFPVFTQVSTYFFRENKYWNTS